MSYVCPMCGSGKCHESMPHGNHPDWIEFCKQNPGPFGPWGVEHELKRAAAQKQTLSYRLFNVRRHFRIMRWALCSFFVVLVFVAHPGWLIVAGYVGVFAVGLGIVLGSFVALVALVKFVWRRV